MIMAVDLTDRAPTASARARSGRRCWPRWRSPGCSPRGARRPPPGGRDRAGPGADGGGARGRGRRRRLLQPDGRETLDSWPDGAGAGGRRAGEAAPQGHARHDPRGDGPEPARHRASGTPRSPTSRSPRASVPRTGATSTSPTLFSWPPGGAPRQRAAAGAPGAEPGPSISRRPPESRDSQALFDAGFDADKVGCRVGVKTSNKGG